MTASLPFVSTPHPGAHLPGAPPPPLTVHGEPGERETLVVLRGEADLATRGVLTAGLAGIDFGRARAVSLQLGDLTFADANAVAQVAAFAAAARRRGYTVATCEPSRLVTRLARLLGVDAHLGLA